MSWVDLLGNDIHYTDTGEGAPIVLIHGHGSAAECWEPHIRHLSERFRVLAYDSYDHGLSANSPRDSGGPDRVDELDAFLAALGIERPVLVGQSMGGMTALLWASRHPRRARAVVSCGMGWPIPGRPAEIASGLDPEGLWLGVGESFTAGWIEANPVEHARYIRIRSTATAIEAARHPRPLSNWGDGDPAEIERGLRGIESPVMLFVGSREHAALAAGVRNTHELIAHSRLVVAEGAAHNAYYEQRELLLASLDGFLSETAETAV